MFNRIGYSLTMLPKDVTDRRWLELQRIAKLKDMQITVLMHYVAVQSKLPTNLIILSTYA